MGVRPVLMAFFTLDCLHSVHVLMARDGCCEAMFYACVQGARIRRYIALRNIRSRTRRPCISKNWLQQMLSSEWSARCWIRCFSPSCHVRVARMWMPGTQVLWYYILAAVAFKSYRSTKTSRNTCILGAI